MNGMHLTVNRNKRQATQFSTNALFVFILLSQIASLVARPQYYYNNGVSYYGPNYRKDSYNAKVSSTPYYYNYNYSHSYCAYYPQACYEYQKPGESYYYNTYGNNYGSYSSYYPSSYPIASYNRGIDPMTNSPGWGNVGWGDNLAAFYLRCSNCGRTGKK